MALSSLFERSHSNHSHFEALLVLGLFTPNGIPLEEGDLIWEAGEYGCDGKGVVKRWAGGDAEGISG